MGIFGKTNGKTPAPRRRPQRGTANERHDAKLQRATKQLAHDIMVKEVFENGSRTERLEMMGAILGHRLTPLPQKTVEERIREEAAANDPEYKKLLLDLDIEEKRAAIEARRGRRDVLGDRLDGLTERYLDEHPEVLEPLMARRISALTAPQSATVSGLKEQMELIGFLRDEFGGQKKDGLLSALGQLAQAAAPLLAPLLGAFLQPRLQQQLPQAQQQQLQLAQPNAGGQVQVQPVQPQPQEQPQPVTATAAAPLIFTWDVTSWIPYVENESPPEDFIAALVIAAKSGDAGAAATIKLLSQVETADDVIGALSAPEGTLTADGEALVAALDCHREWLQSVINKLHGVEQ